MSTQRTRLIQIGNLQGVRIPRSLLEQAGISEWVELEAHQGEIAICPSRSARAGWAEQFAAMHEAGDDALIDSPQPGGAWDEVEWQ